MARLRKRWGASALVHVLTLFLLVSLLVSTAFLVVRIYFFPARELADSISLHHTIHDAVELALAKHPELPEHIRWQPFLPDLFSDPTVGYRKFRHGAYELYAIRASNLRDTVGQAFSLGYASPDVALFLGENNRLIRYAGNAQVEGVAFIPTKGIKKAYIEGKSPQQTQLVNGPTRTSPGSLPPELLHWLSELALVTETLAHPLPLVKDSLHVSFLDDPKVRVVTEPVLQDVSLSGNLTLISDRPLRIDASCQLRDVVIKAPSIELGAELYADHIQCIATDSIRCESGIELGYPSLLLIQNNNGTGQLTLAEGSFVHGDVVYHNSDPNADRSKPSIQIETGATVQGTVLTNADLDLRGSVKGSVYCSRFLLITPSAVYENHLLDGEIDQYERSLFQLSALPYSPTNQLQQWLD